MKISDASFTVKYAFIPQSKRVISKVKGATQWNLSSVLQEVLLTIERNISSNITKLNW